MQVKTFSGSSNKEVLDMIKADLGSEAVILDTRTGSLAGKKVVTMTAALEREDAGPGEEGGPGGLGAHAAQAAGQGLSRHFLAEWNSVKKHLFALMKPALNLENLSPSQRTALEYLQREGASDQVLLELYRKLARNPKEPVLGPLTGMLPVKPWGYEHWPQRIHLIAGPYGAGKTTAAVRMALALERSRGLRSAPAAAGNPARPAEAEEFEELLAEGYGSSGPAGGLAGLDGRAGRAGRAAAGYGRQSAYAAEEALAASGSGGRVCIVNADAERGNGRLLLKHYAGLSDFAYREASNAMEMRGVLSEITAQGFERIIVDLPGLPRGAHLRDLVDRLGLEGASAIKTAVHLVLSPHYDDSLSLDLLERYSLDLPGSLVWSKLDEFGRYGALLNLALASGLPVSCLSFGPGLLNTLLPVTQVMLWRLVFKHELPVNSAPGALSGQKLE